MDFLEFCDFVNTLTSKSGEILRQFYYDPSGYKVEFKADNTPVTIADRAVETALRSLIERHYPAHGVIGEE